MALPNNPITRKEAYLAKIAGQEVEIPAKPITREEAYLNQIAKEGMGTKVIANPDDVAEDVLHKVEIDGEIYSVPSGGGSGTSDYPELDNKPQINGVELSGNKTTGDLGIKFEDLPDAPTLGTASAKNVPVSGDASSSQVVMGNDSRLSDSRPASDVSSWAKQSTKPTYTASEVGAIPSTDKGANGGVAELDSNGKVPSSQLPSYVDDVLSYASQSAFPANGETGKIYIAEDTNKTYRWSGSIYAEISESLALGETSSTAYRGDRGKVAYDHSQTTGNPHGTTAADVGLGNVPNVSTNDQTPTFSESSTRNNIASGEKLSVIFGKIQKFFNDLKTVAFSGSYNDLSDQPTIPTTASDISYDNTDSGLTATDVQGAVDELAESYPASKVIMTGGENVEDALNKIVVNSCTLTYYDANSLRGKATIPAGFTIEDAFISVPRYDPYSIKGRLFAFIAEGSLIVLLGSNFVSGDTVTVKVAWMKA